MLKTMITMMIIFSHSHLVRAQLGAGHNSSASWPPCTLGSKHWSDHQFFFQFSFQILMLAKTPGHILQQCWRELFDLQNKITRRCWVESTFDYMPPQYFSMLVVRMVRMFSTGFFEDIAGCSARGGGAPPWQMKNKTNGKMETWKKVPRPGK